jgi:hypothetical protein
VTGVRLRPAAAADLPAIACIWREGWVDGHQGHVPATLVAERTPASFDQRALATGTVPVPPTATSARSGTDENPLSPRWQLEIIGKGAS